MELQGKRKATVWLVPALALYLLLAAAVVYFVARGGAYPDGSDTMYHIHRAELVYRALQSGVAWPAYDPLWYNGVEILRYWPPLTPYLMALCQWAALGDPFDGYLLFVGLLCALGALPWLYIGCKLRRPALGAFFGALWFFMPNNLHALFVEGNLPRALSMLFLPLCLYHVTAWLWERGGRHLTGISLFFALMALCHVGYAGMLALAVLLFLLIYVIAQRASARAALAALAAMLLGFALDGILILPALSGGIANVDSSEAMAGFFQSLPRTLDPLLRLMPGDAYRGSFYFGLAAFLLALFGTLCAPKEAIPGFLTGALTCVFTSTAFFSLFRGLPGGQYLWMLRFVSIALCMILLSFLRWNTLKRPLAVLCCVLLALDALPSLRLVYGAHDGATPAERFDTIRSYALLDRAQEITTQRLAVINEGAGGMVNAYLCSDWRKPTANTFGAGWEAAVTANNIKMLNRAANEGAYLYLFDRALELGNDTVLVRNAALLDLLRSPLEELDAAAAQVGYELLEYSDAFRLYHLRAAPERWGTADRYPAIAIASHAGTALSFPGMEEAPSNNLDDYDYERLSRYDLVFLGDFTCTDRARAEELLLRLSESGTRVVIVVDGIPEDHATHERSFLGVRCNAIRFANGYPELDTVCGTLNADLFPSGFTDWHTVYVEGLDDVWGTVRENELSLPFCGTARNDNLMFVGLNLPYFHELTHDAAVGALLARLLCLPEHTLPERRLVSLTVETVGNDVTVVSPEDGVNTTLAYHDVFVSDAPFYERNHLTCVGAGTTRLHLAYPAPAAGTALSLAGACGAAVMAAASRRRTCGGKNGEKETKQCDAAS